MEYNSEAVSMYRNDKIQINVIISLDENRFNAAQCSVDRFFKHTGNSMHEC